MSRPIDTKERHKQPERDRGCLTNHVGFILDYISELFHRDPRHIGAYGTLWEKWFDRQEGRWSARDRRSIDRTFSGMTKLIFPDGIKAINANRNCIE